MLSVTGCLLQKLSRDSFRVKYSGSFKGYVVLSLEKLGKVGIISYCSNWIHLEYSNFLLKLKMS